MSIHRPLLALAVLATASCMPPQSASNMQTNNPLGPSFWVIPTPSDDDGLLGRTFSRPPDTALSLEEQSQPNPCAEKLAEARIVDMTNSYENAIDVKTVAGGGAMLGMFGFSADASVATHLLYKVQTQRKQSRLDTHEYVECCQTANCGWGYVSALIYGEGEYASGQKADVAAQGNYQIYSGGGSHSYNLLNKRNIKGYLAAVITAHDRSQAVQACASDQEWAGIECVKKGEIQEQQSKCRGNLGMMNMLQAHQGDEDDEEAGASVEQLMKMMQQQACDWLDRHKQPR
jgi:hypothetical protein